MDLPLHLAWHFEKLAFSPEKFQQEKDVLLCVHVTTKFVLVILRIFCHRAYFLNMINE